MQTTITKEQYEESKDKLLYIAKKMGTAIEMGNADAIKPMIKTHTDIVNAYENQQSKIVVTIGIPIRINDKNFEQIGIDLSKSDLLIFCNVEGRVDFVGKKYIYRDNQGKFFGSVLGSDQNNFFVEYVLKIHEVTGAELDEYDENTTVDFDFYEMSTSREMENLTAYLTKKYNYQYGN